MSSHARHKSRPARGNEDALRRAFLIRSKTLLDDVAAKASPQALATALAAGSSVGGLAILLNEMIGGAIQVGSVDPLAKAVARGAARKEALLAEAGGSLGVTDVASLLGISRQAVEKRRKSHGLLAVPSGTGDYRYPIIQFSDDGVLPGLSDVLRAFPDDVSPWTRLDMLLSRPDRLSTRLIDAVRAGRIEDAVRVAATYAEHGA